VYMVYRWHELFSPVFFQEILFIGYLILCALK
jgi:hypothetical protein